MRKLTFSSSQHPPLPPLPPADLPPSLADPSQPFPRLIVFDLDYTLWDFWCDTHPSPPLKPSPSHTLATDRHGEAFTFYPPVPRVLLALPHLCAAHRIRLAVASRTNAPPTARDLLKMLHMHAGPTPAPTPTPPTSTSTSTSTSSPGDEQDGVVTGASKRKATPMLDAFDAGLEIYPGSKVRHMESLHKRTGVAYEDMLFFDDEERNRDTERLGVVMQLVRDGVDWEQVAQGVEEWRRRKKARA